MNATKASMKLEEAYKMFREGLVRFLTARTGDPELAGDLVQETFVKIMNHLQNGESLRNPKAYIYKTALNVMRDHFRKNKVRSAIDGNELNTDYGEMPENIDACDMPDDVLIRECLHLIVDTLPEPYNQAVKSADLDQIPQTQMARTAGLSDSGMKSRVQRGRQMLRKKLLEIIRLGPDACPCAGD